MNTLTKVFIVAMLVLSLLVTVATASLFAQRTNWYKQYTDAKAEIDKAKTAQRAAEQKAEEQIRQADDKLREEVDLHKLTKGERDKYKADWESVRTKLNERDAEAQQLRDTLEGAQRNIADLQKRNDRVEQQLVEIKKDRDNAYKEKMEAIQDAVQLEKLVDAKEQQLRATERMLRQEQEKMQRASGEEIAPAYKIEGTITSITDGYIAISVGSDDKVQDGDEFTVFRGATYVSRVRVVRAGRDVSVAKEMPEWRNGSEIITVGDGVSNAIR
ncbi:MAG: hypothetical protein V2A58_11190 [Planctomycetota bacterium]